MEPSGELSEQGTTAVAAAKAKDKKAWVHLLQCLPDDLLMQVAAKKTGKEVWDSLKVRFIGEESVKKARLQTLKSEFDVMRMKVEESIDGYAGRLTGMSVRYGNLGGMLDDVALVKKLFDTMPECYINVVVGIEQFYDLKKLAFDEAVGRLKALSGRLGRSGQPVRRPTEVDHRMAVAVGVGVVEVVVMEEEVARPIRQRRVLRSGKKDKSHIQCFKCHRYGHYANRCPREKEEEEAHHVLAVDVEPSLLLVETEEPGLLEYTSQQIQGGVTLNGGMVQPELHFTGSQESTREIWYLDNGASNHMSGDRLKFREFDQTFTGKVQFRDGFVVEIQGRGSILFQWRTRD
ncbi:uncharacterized protein [Miscanthus floridulus]|uniref:uncharacterized protein n=1 Tax=Miscanthus floridulus TaxID=154761 RepID=UPI003457E925